MERMFINRQNVFCSSCMNINIPNVEWTRYRYIGSQNVWSEGSNSLSAALFPICCFYKYNYSHSKGKNADYNMYRRYKHLQDLCLCREKMDECEYDDILPLLESINSVHPNIIVYFPQKIKKNWEKYKIFHFTYFTYLLNQVDIKYSFDINSLQDKNLLNTNAETIVIFEITTNANSIAKNTNEIIKIYNQQPPNLVYISFLTEVKKNGDIIYFKKNDIERIFK